MISLVILRLIRKFMVGKKKVPEIKSHTNNPALKTIWPDWSGTPLDQDGLFINYEYPTIIKFREILKFLFQTNPSREVKKLNTWRITVLKNTSWLNSLGDRIVWFGHASFFVQLSGIRILIDPMFFKLPITKRYSEMPVDPDKLLDIDYILVSHAHYDHCDKRSLKLLSANNPQAEILCGLELDHLINKWISNPVQTAGWFQQYTTIGDIKITFLPSRHWANRSVCDANSTLWGGFMLQSAGKCIYYGGDSGFGSHFGHIGMLFPHIDVALIGAGAYAPVWFMGQHHQDPYKAVDAFHATGAKTLIPFHYGTFDSADEPLGEPEQILNKLNSEGKIRNELKILKLGESFNL